MWVSCYAPGLGTMVYMRFPSLNRSCLPLKWKLEALDGEAEADGGSEERDDSRQRGARGTIWFSLGRSASEMAAPLGCSVEVKEIHFH